MTQTLASTIDHTLLKADATEGDIERLCDEAAREHFASVCVLPHRVKQARQALAGSHVVVCAVVGFPLGANHPSIKVAEAVLAMEYGATELDVVANIGAIKDGNWALVELDIRGVVDAADKRGAIVKVILETAALTQEEKARAARIAIACGAAFLKTSTGFAPQGGATIEDVRLLREIAGTKAGVKASGGIRSREDAQAMIDAGASRIGTSAGLSIIRDASHNPRPRC